VTAREKAILLVRGAVSALERSRSRIDDLNVYPVPDGDTGTNLALTARAVLEELEGSTADDSATVAREATRAALMGARWRRRIRSTVPRSRASYAPAPMPPIGRCASRSRARC
jgi:hypothetical protein